ncbi:DUF3558 family protein [Amycolatopsis thermoflava]|uniref:DUF3558 family protein n=1 Tax=Amycolatopsis thermoflava TaxID=84480 RepID=UPI003EBC340D
MNSAMRSLAALSTFAVVIAGAAACSDEGDDPILPTTAPASTSTSSAGSSNSAPAVSEPLDEGKFLGDPCSSLTSSQKSDLGVEQQGRQAVEGGCSWEFGPNSEWIVQVTYIRVAGGLANDYDKNATGAYKDGYFEPATVAGYPAAFSSLADFRPTTCDLNVGLNSEAIFHVTVRGDATKDNCKAATNVAARVIDTIKAGRQ